VTYRWRVPTPLRYAARPAAAVAAGLCLWLAFPEANLWGLAPVGVALLGAATLTAGARQGALLGLLAGLAFFVPVLSWSGVYVGALPWFALAVLEALYVAAMSAVVGYAGKRLTAAGRPGAAYLAVPVGWVVQEWARGATPYGGFPWARLAFSQADSPLAHVARWLGAPGVTFAVATVGTLLLVAGSAAARRAWLPAASAAVAGVALVVLAPLAIPLPTDGRPVSVGFVQGNVPQAGLEFNAQRRAVLDNHVSGTEQLAKRVPDDLTLVVWPENSSDIDPFRNPDAAAQIDNARRAVGVPLLIGAVLDEPPGHGSNVSLFYLPGVAEPQRYVKLHPVPFAEYIPSRRFFRRRLCRAADDLLRGGVRPADAQQRRGGGGSAEPARRADQQRHLRLHRRVRAAVRDLTDPGHRARPVGRARLDRRGVRFRRARRVGDREDRAVHGRPAGGRSGGAHRTHPGRPARCGAGVGGRPRPAAPRGREHRGGPER